MNLDYCQKQEKPLFPDLAWNLPEQKSGRILTIGGNQQSFRAPYQIATFLSSNFPLESTEILLPASLKSTLPPLETLHFAPATKAGSFADSNFFNPEKPTSPTPALPAINAQILAGDFSKNSETATALNNLLKTTPTPTYLARETLDLSLDQAADWLAAEPTPNPKNPANPKTKTLTPRLTLVASLLQLQKLFRAIYYPKMLLLSSPLPNILEVLHKFTLSYPCQLLTLHENQIILAYKGKLITTPLEKTPYTPLTLWQGNLAATLAVFNLYNPKKPLESSAAALLHK